MDEATAKTTLDETLTPALATDEGRKFLEAQERQMEMLVSKIFFEILFLFLYLFGYCARLFCGNYVPALDCPLFSIFVASPFSLLPFSTTPPFPRYSLIHLFPLQPM